MNPPCGAFRATGATALVNANTTALNGVLLVGDPGTDPLGERQYRLCNPGNQTVYFAYGASNTAAASAAIIPTNASVGGAIPVLTASVEVVTAPVNQYWTAVSTSANFAVFITSGKGT